MQKTEQNYTLEEIKDFLKENYNINWDGNCLDRETGKPRKATLEDFKMPVFIDLKNDVGLLLVSNTQFALSAYSTIMQKRSNEWKQQIESKQTNMEI